MVYSFIIHSGYFWLFLALDFWWLYLKGQEIIAHKMIYKSLMKKKTCYLKEITATIQHNSCGCLYISVDTFLFAPFDISQYSIPNYGQSSPSVFFVSPYFAKIITQNQDKINPVFFHIQDVNLSNENGIRTRCTKTLKI